MKNRSNSPVFWVRFLVSALLLTASVPHVFATNVSEPPDFSNTSPGNTTVLTLGANVFSGTVMTTADGRDYFRVTVPAGMRITQVSKTVTGGSFSGGVNFNNETITGEGTTNFTGQSATPYPLPAGTYDAFVYADFSAGSSWSVTVTVGATPDYSVSTMSGQITVSDNAGNSDTLNITSPAAGFIKFAAAGRTFSVNGGSLISGDSGNLSLLGVNYIYVYPGNGTNTENISAFSGAFFPSLTISSGTNSDTVNFNGNITFAPDNYLDVELATGSTNANSVNVAAGANLITSGAGTITILSSRNIQLNSGSRLQVQNGDMDMEANQQSPATPGNFTGLNLDGATMQSTGSGSIIAKGTGGTDPGGYQLGVQVINGAEIIGGTSGYVSVYGAGGNSTGIVNRGVTVYGAGSAITSAGAYLYLIGDAGSIGTGYGIGVSVLSGGEISAGGSGQINLTANGGGASGDSNRGLELSGSGSLITSGGGIIIHATAGPGNSSGIYMANSSAITTPAAGGYMDLFADSATLDSTVSITTTNAASSITFGAETFGTLVDLGGANATGNPATLGLTDAELDRINTENLYLGLNCGGVTISAPITQPYATNLTILPGLNGSLYATASGTDVSLVNDGTVTVQFGAAAFPITGPVPDSGYPQLNISGRVALYGTSLNLSNSTYSGNVGDVFTLISNDGTNPVTGTFNGLPEGSYVSLDGQPARIYYDGGDGNDVVLVRSLPELSVGAGLTNGTWNFTGLGLPTNTYTIQATTNFINWTNIGTAFTDTNDNFIFTDSNAYKFPYRFYRITN